MEPRAQNQEEDKDKEGGHHQQETRIMQKTEPRLLPNDHPYPPLDKNNDTLSRIPTGQVYATTFLTNTATTSPIRLRGNTYHATHSCTSQFLLTEQHVVVKLRPTRTGHPPFLHKLLLVNMRRPQCLLISPDLKKRGKKMLPGYELCIENAPPPAPMADHEQGWETDGFFFLGRDGGYTLRRATAGTDGDR